MDMSVRGAADSTLPRRVGAWILRELRGALPPTIFFFIGFNFIILTTNLLVADYAVAVSNFMLATVAALVVGKAVITANAEVYPSVVTSGMPVMSSVTKATTTVPPAKQIALPAVATARAIASSSSMPSFRFAR